MKKLILLMLLFLSVTFESCSEYNENCTLTQVNAMVLNRRTYYTAYAKGAGGVTHYQVYLFDGIESKWYETDEETYRKLRPRDTIASYVLTIVKTIKK